MESNITRKRNCFFGYILVILVLGIGMAGNKVYVHAASKNETYGIMKEDDYRKTLCKDFLGKPYGSVIDGIRCDCSGYTRAALNRMESSSTGEFSFKNYKVYARSSAEWVRGSKVKFISAKVEGDTLTWNKKKTKKKIGKVSKNHKKLSTLKLGDVMVYGKGSYANHIAIYFGEFSTAEEVRDYLVNLGIYKKRDLKKTSDGKYMYQGRTIIRAYTKRTYWRIHATNSGILIDNDIAGEYSGAASFGKWKWTFASGIRTE